MPPYCLAMPSFAAVERDRLADTALAAGATAPTLCGDWTVLDLMAHLVVREGDPLGAPGILVPALEFLTDRAMKRATRDGLATLVERFRTPGMFSPFRIAAVDKQANTLEFFVHHEDIRRAGAAWEPRELTEREQNTLWRAVATPGKGLVRPAGVPVELRWGEHTRTLRGGAEPVVVTGEPAELVLFLFGRAQHRDLVFEGPDDSVAQLKDAKLGL
ncbi:MAG: hypothetical protein JWO46_495 [Nocardioidaceae bacterium]|nr:hypothetical protein [Nocardioidaceae bacterium]